jgi:xylulokinase
MSLLGIDVGTTGCKAVLFSEDGRALGSAYEEYDWSRPQPGWAELDALAVWETVKRVIRRAAVAGSADPPRALAISSLGEAVVPVSARREVLGPSILNFDMRGEEFLQDLGERLPSARLYPINGNTLGNHYSLTKLLWTRAHQPTLYERADKFLLWGSLVSFMLGAEPAVDYSLANRTLLFDLERGDWSDELLREAGIERAKLPRTVPSGTAIGTLAPAVARELGLPAGLTIVSGAHDQCANAVGCGVIEEGVAVYGMGTYICITPVFRTRRPAQAMIERGLNTEHHAVPGAYVTFIYNPGGALVKWFRDTCAAAERDAARAAGRDIYAELIAEVPAGPSSVVVLPHFAPTGPPAFIADSAGVLAGLRLETTRGDILKGILEGTAFYLKECVDGLPPTGIRIEEFRATGGGSKSDTWVQLSADIFGRPFVRPAVTEAGALGAALIAGVGCGVFGSFADGVQAMVRLERTFEPDATRQAQYGRRFALYARLWPLMADYLRELTAAQRG